MSLSIRRCLMAAFMSLPLFALATGCGDGKEKAEIPEKFVPKPDKAPSVGGVPNPGAGVPKKNKPPADL